MRSENALHIFCLLAVAFLVTFLLVGPVKALAVRLDAIDYPGGRRVNKWPVPRLGGLAIASGAVAAMLLHLLGEVVLGWPPLLDPQVNAPLLTAGFFVALAVGVVDDVRSLSPKAKLAGQTVAALLVSFSGVLFFAIKNPVGSGFIEFGLGAYPLTVLYLLLFMNAINLIDGLDGLCGGIVAIALATLLAVAASKGNAGVVVCCAALLGAVLAFLRFNLHPASVFMGDSGSLFLGLSLGVLSLAGVMRSPYVTVLAAPLAVAVIPFLDSFAAVVRRLRGHQPLEQADKSHVHHRLMVRGLAEEQVVLVLWGWTAVLGILAFFLASSAGLWTMCLIGVVLALSFVLFWKLGVFEPALRHHYTERPGKPVADVGEDLDEALTRADS